MLEDDGRLIDFLARRVQMGYLYHLPLILSLIAACRELHQVPTVRHHATRISEGSSDRPASTHDYTR